MRIRPICLGAILFFAPCVQPTCDDLSVFNRYWFAMLLHYDENDPSENAFETKTPRFRRVSSEIVYVTMENSVPTEHDKRHVSELSTYPEHFRFMNYEYDPGTRTQTEFFYDESGEIKYVWKRSFYLKVRLVRYTFRMLLPRKMESTTSYSYDEKHRTRTVKETDSQKGTSTIVEVFNELGYLSKYTYEDSAGRNEYLYSYDDKGNISDEQWIIDGQLYKHREYSYSENATARLERDAAGNLFQSIRAVFENERIVREEMLLSGSNINRTYVYDVHGNLIKQKGPMFEKTYQYDDKDRMIQATFGNTRTWWHYPADDTIVVVYSLVDYEGYSKKIMKDGELVFLEIGRYIRDRNEYVPERRVYVSIEYLN